MNKKRDKETLENELYYLSSLDDTLPVEYSDSSYSEEWVSYDIIDVNKPEDNIIHLQRKFNDRYILEKVTVAIKSSRNVGELLAELTNVLSEL